MTDIESSHSVGAAIANPRADNVPGVLFLTAVVFPRGHRQQIERIYSGEMSMGVVAADRTVGGRVDADRNVGMSTK